MSEQDASEPGSIDRIRRDAVPGYRLQKALGRGAVGVVYQARSLSESRLVAIKFLHPDFSDSDKALTRLTRESLATARLHHPNIVRSQSTGIADGLFYIIFEYVEGETLADLLKRRKALPWREAVRIAHAVAEGLSAAHGRKVVHRDIKPANIMLTSQGEIKIADFGLAKGAADATVTETGLLVGTPYFASPEQVQNQVQIDARSDIYSLGIMLYLMVTGEQPFEEASLPLLLSRKVVQEIPDPRLVAEDLPENLALTILKMARRHRDERYPSGAEAAQALAALMEVADSRPADGSGSSGAELQQPSLPVDSRHGRDELINDTSTIPGLKHPLLRSIFLKSDIPARVLRMKPEEILFLEGQAGKDAYVLLKGSLEIIRAGRTIAHIDEPGEFVGEMSYLIDAPRSATVRAASKVILLRIREEEFDHLVDRVPEIAIALSVSLAGKLKATNDLLERTEEELVALKSRLRELVRSRRQAGDTGD